MKSVSIAAVVLVLLGSNGLLVGQAQNRRGSSAPVKISAEEAATHLLTTMKPAYPHDALVNAIQGPVVLQAVVGKDGSIEKLKIISGDPMLTHAFADTVQQKWRYKPFLVNGAPVEAEFPIEYVFKLD